MLNEVLSSEEIFNKVDAIRKSKDWTFYKLAKDAGISKSALYNWRDKRSQPSLYLIEAISEAFKMPIINLLFENELLMKLDEQQKSLMTDFFALNGKQQKTLRDMIDLFKKN